MKAQRFVPKRNLQSSDMGSEFLILDQDMGELLRLNSAARFIWKQLDGQRTSEEIAQTVAREFDVQKNKAEQDVEELLRELIRLEIIQSPGR